jgi:hypothetical protein
LPLCASPLRIHPHGWRLTLMAVISTAIHPCHFRQRTSVAMRVGATVRLLASTPPWPRAPGICRRAGSPRQFPWSASGEVSQRFTLPGLAYQVPFLSPPCAGLEPPRCLCPSRSPAQAAGLRRAPGTTAPGWRNQTVRVCRWRRSRRDYHRRQVRHLRE